MWWYLSVNPTVGKMRHVDYYKFKLSLGCVVPNTQSTGEEKEQEEEENRKHNLGFYFPAYGMGWDSGSFEPVLT